MAKWKLAQGATWRGKLESQHENHGKLLDPPPALQKRYGKGKMLIPRPLDVDAAIRKVRKGSLVTPAQLRDKLAADAGAASACPFSTGIFLKIIAESAEEDRRAGKRRITPYWRVVQPGGKLNEKFPGGALAQAAQLEQEGFEILEGKGKQPPHVENYERYLANL